MYDVYGFDKVLADKWTVFNNTADDTDFDFDKAEELIRRTLSYRDEPKSYKGRWNKDMAYYNPSVPFYDMASRLDELHTKRNVHPHFVDQDTDKQILAYNKHNAFPTFQNKYGSGETHYRSGPFPKIRDRFNSNEQTNGFFHLLETPIALTNKSEDANR